MQKAFPEIDANVQSPKLDHVWNTVSNWSSMFRKYTAREKLQRRVTRGLENFCCKREKIKKYAHLAKERTAERVCICPWNEEEKISGRTS